MAFDLQRAIADFRAVRQPGGRYPREYASIVWLANKLAGFKIDRPMRVEARFAPFGSVSARFA
jgi:hypothetical protein